MNRTISEYEQLVIDIITIKTGEDKSWQRISYNNIEEAARHVEYAVDLALRRMRVAGDEE